ncbi:MAG: hypothetical protein M3167_02290 [Acidobacteriota bacterium]|nr:hypothetical protein [Acidobacteriota bacterium]
MSGTVVAIWWVALGLALLLTVVAAYFLIEVIHACRQIRELARKTVPAALGIARNTSAIADLSVVLKLAPTLLSVAGGIDAASKKIALTLDSVAPPRES